jgi:hypothetical protein
MALEPIRGFKSRRHYIGTERLLRAHDLDSRFPAATPPGARPPDDEEVALRLGLADAGVRDLPPSGNSSDIGRRQLRSWR